jgi:diaminopimelate epimerase
MKIFRSHEDAIASAMQDTLRAAIKAGFTEHADDEGHVLCLVPDTNRLVDVFPDGSWEFQDVNDDGSMETMSGNSAVMLALYLHGDNAKIFKECQSDDNENSAQE